MKILYTTLQFILFFFLTYSAFCQNYTLEGKVVDSLDIPLPGASIILKGTKIGTTTNIDGKYKLQWSSIEKPKIVISYLGMIPQEVQYSGQSTLDIRLQEEVNSLNEIVITGVQSIDKKNATGAYTILNQENIKPIYSTNIIDKLEGAAPGVYVDKNNNITIRGVNTINANSKPLIVVDGFPLESSELNLNPADIDQITILKDAASAAIWGIRAANGVIVITTKRGDGEKTIKVNYSSNVTFSNKIDLNDLHLLSSDQYVNLLFEDYQNDVPYMSGTSGGDYNDVENIFMQWYDYEITDEEAQVQLSELGSFNNKSQIEDNFYRSSFTQQHNISLTAGGEKSTSYLSLNYDQNLTELIGNDYQKVNILLNTDYNFTNNFKAKFNIRGTNQWNQENGSNAALNYEPWQRILNEDGSYYDESYTLVNKEYQEALYEIGFKDWSKNILETTRMNDNKTDNYNFTTSLGLEWTPITNLNLTTQFTYELGQEETTNFYSSDHYYVRNLTNRFTEVELSEGYPIAIKNNHLPVEGGIKDISNSNFKSYSFRNKITYDLKINDLKSQIMVGNDIYSLEGDSYGDRLWGYNDDYLTSNSINLTELNNGVRGYNGRTQRLSYAPSLSATLERYASWFGTLSLNYKNKYNIFSSIRLDQTNLLVNATKFRNNPSWSISGKWNVTNEPFWNNTKTINGLAIRASYGLSGNIDKSTTPDITGTFYKEYSVTSLNVLSITNPANPALGWEKTFTTNIGIDLTMFSHKLDVTLDFYQKRSTDLLSTVKNDATTGWTSFKSNSAAMINKGIDFMLKGQLLETKDLRWNTTLNFSYNYNEVTDYKYTTSPLSSVYGSIVEGKPLHQITSIKYGGLDENGEPTFLKHNDDTKYSYSELSSLTEEDLVEEGRTTPPFFGSFHTTLGWKNFTLGVMLTYQFGHKMRMPSPSVSGGLYTEWAGDQYRWVEGLDNTGKLVPKLYDGYGGNEWAPSRYWDTYNYSDLMTESASVLRLRSIRLDYDLTKTFNKINIAGGSIGISGENLAYWAKNSKNLDPNTISEDFFGYTTTLSTPARFLLNFNINF